MFFGGRKKPQKVEKKNITNPLQRSLKIIEYVCLCNTVSFVIEYSKLVDIGNLLTTGCDYVK